MAITRAQYLAPGGSTPVLAGQLQGVKQGNNVIIASDGSISVATASTAVPGIVQLNNTLSSTSTTQALTAYQGKILQDQIDSFGANQVIFNPYGSIASTNVQGAIEELDDQVTTLGITFKYIDDISSQFNGAATTFNLTVGGSPFIVSGSNLAVFVGGVFQEPGPSYTVTANQITFSEAPLANSSFAGIYGAPSSQGGGGGGGTVTSVGTGTGLVGGPITSTGTISIANGGIVNSMVSNTAAIDSEKLRYLAPFGGAVGRSVEAALSDVFNLKDFGAVGDGATDNATALKSALDAINLNGGGTLYVPAGIYRVTNVFTNLISTDIVIKGDGPSSSQFKYIDNSAPGNRRDFLQARNGAAGLDADITIRDLAIVGDWGEGGSYTQQSHLLSLDVTGNILLENLWLSQSRFFAAAIGNGFSQPSLCKSVIANNCRVTDCAADGISTRGCLQTIVTNCYFNNVNDDAVAVHTQNAATAPIQSYAVVANNNFVDCQGIACLGAAHTVITGNSLTRVSTRAIVVQGPGTSGFPEGNNNIYSINISNNVIDTVFSGFTFSPSSGDSVHYITVTAGLISSTSSGYPNNPNGSGGILSPYPYFYSQGAPSVSAPCNGAYSVVISNNVCMRSLGPVARYSDYGFGSRLGRTGPSNPEITNNALGVGGTGGQIQLTGGFNNLVVSNNVCYGGSRGVTLSADDLNTTNLTNCKITGNVFSNYTQTGVYLYGYGDVTVSDNMFDADPLHTSIYRTSNGRWLVGGTGNVGAIWMGSDLLVNFINNHIKNVYQVFIGSTPDAINAVGNTMYANPVSQNNINNIGIASMNLPLANNRNTLVVYDSDPSSGTYGRVLNVCLQANGTYPSSGLYLTGWVVNNTNPSIRGVSGARYITQGWIRLTNGRNHVLNTDWAELRCLTGT